MDQTGVLVDAEIDFHPFVSQVALLGLVHLRISFPVSVFGGAGRRDQGGIDDRSLPHGHSPGAEMGFDDLIDDVFYVAVDLFSQLVLLNEVAATWP